MFDKFCHLLQLSVFRWLSFLHHLGIAQWYSMLPSYLRSSKVAKWALKMFIFLQAKSDHLVDFWAWEVFSTIKVIPYWACRGPFRYYYQNPRGDERSHWSELLNVISTTIRHFTFLMIHINLFTIFDAYAFLTLSQFFHHV